MSVTKERKAVARSVVLALGIVFIVALAGVVGAFSYYIIDKNNTIASLDAQIFQLNANVTDLQNQVASDNSVINSLTSSITSLQSLTNSIINGLTHSLNMITSDPSAWVNKTVVVDGSLSLEGVNLPMSIPPWNHVLSSDNQTIGVAWWGVNQSELVQVFGIVRQGKQGIPWTNPQEYKVVYYILAIVVEPL